MKIQKVELHNFASFYGHHELTLGNQGLIFISGKNHDEPKLVSNGAGKCLAPDTRVLRFDGSSVEVKDLQVGDQLFGPDSSARVLQEIHTGHAPMYRVIPTKGDSWECNGDHLLYMYRHDYKEYVTLSVADYLELPSWRKRMCMLVRSEGVEFPDPQVDIIDPYFYGVWVGEGTKALARGRLVTVVITNPEQEILACCESVAEDHGCSVNTFLSTSGGCPSHRIVGGLPRGPQGGSNPILTALQELWGDGTRGVHSSVKLGSVETRYAFLAGILDTDGYLGRNTFEIAQKNKAVARDILFIARSLGLAATSVVKVVNDTPYIRMSISGHTDRIPTRIERKQAGVRQINKKPHHVGFEIESIGCGSFVGFEVDQDHLFLLEDFTLIHNSSALDAIDWALFGKVPKDDHADSVVNEQAKKECWVAVHLLDGEEKALVVRKRKPNGFEFWRNGISPALDTSETQKQLEEFLGLDRRVFHAAVYRAQNDKFDFAEATDAQKKELLSKMIPEFEEIDRLRVAAVERMAPLHYEKENLDRKLTETESQLTILGAKDWDALQREWEESRQAQLDEIELAITEWQNTEKGARGKLGDIEALRAEHTRLVTWQAEHKQQERQPEDPCVQAYFDGITRLDNMRYNLGGYDKSLSDLSGVSGSTCPTCVQPVSQEHAHKATAWLEANRANAEKAYQAEFQRVEELRVKKEAYEADLLKKEEEDRQKRTDTALRIGEMQARTVQYAETENILKHAIAQVDERKRRYQATVDRVWPHQEQKDADAVKERALQSQYESLTGEYQALEASIRIMQFWVDACGLQGIKSFILDTRLQDMTNAANVWVQALTGGTHWVQFESTSQTRGGKQVDKVNVKVFRREGGGVTSARNYQSYSGGEKKRIALGIDQGLASLVASRASKPWQLYILDEAFRQNMDSGGREAIFDILDQLKAEKETILVCDHDPELAGHFESVWTVEKKNGRSAIRRGENECLKAVNS